MGSGFLRRGTVFLCAAVLACTVLQVDVPRAEAEGFQVDDIISDEVMFNGAAMNAREVQAFLDAKVPRCTLGDYGREKGKPWGSTSLAWTCLKDYRGDVLEKKGDQYCAAMHYRVGASAAEIIAEVGAACNVSQKAILVLLQKEQSLVTDSWPTVRMFDYATGFGCPDSGPDGAANCSSHYLGFFNQVFRAARQYQIYRLLPDHFNFAVGRTSFVGYHPAPSRNCGGVYITPKNAATAGLYNFTPYVPNAAALAAGNGTGDACSSYGNRNFFNFYVNWFGSTHATEPRIRDEGELLGVSPDGTIYNYGRYPYGPSVKRAIGSGFARAVSVTAVDWNSDGRVDLVAQWPDGNLLWYPQNAQGGWNPGVLVGFGWQGLQIKITKFSNADVYPSVVAKSGDGALFLYGRVNDTHIGGREQIGHGWQGLDVSILDYTGDGNKDVLAIAGDGNMFLYQTDGAGRFLSKPGEWLAWGWNMWAHVQSIASLREPGSLGLLGVDGAGRLGYYDVSPWSIGPRQIIGTGWQDYRLVGK